MRHSGIRFGTSKQTFRPLPPVFVVLGNITTSIPHYSYNGIDWLEGTGQADAICQAGIYGNKYLFGGNARILVSDDGINFTQSTPSIGASGGANVEHILWSPYDNKFHLLTSGAGNFIHRSSDSGTSWNIDFQASLNGGGFLATPAITNFAFLAPLRSAPVSGQYDHYIYGSVSGTSFDSLYSLSETAAGFSYLNSVSTGDKFIAFPSDGSKIVVGTAIDSWSEVSTTNLGTAASSIRQVAYSPKYNRLVESSGTTIRYSNDFGETWTTTAATVATGSRRVKWSQLIEKFIYISLANTNVLLSDDGITWATHAGVLPYNPSTVIAR